jgi:hypothetical protein
MLGGQKFLRVLYIDGIYFLFLISLLLLSLQYYYHHHHGMALPQVGSCEYIE